jgi:nucleoside-diphosphate-sugar epimerase
MLQYDTDNMLLPCKENNQIYPYYNKYVFSKFLAEHVSHFYRQYFQIIDIRLSNVYGPTPLSRPDIIPSLVWSLIKNEKTYVRTTVPIRDFVFVNDVINAVLLLLDTDFSGPINVGSGFGRSVNDVCQILEKLSGKKIFNLGQKHTGHLEYWHDLALLKSLVSFTPTILEDGLAITYKTMLDKYA